MQAIIALESQDPSRSGGPFADDRRRCFYCDKAKRSEDLDSAGDAVAANGQVNSGSRESSKSAH